MFTSADLTFDPATHTSRTPDGLIVPHVSRVLKGVGLAADFEALAGWSRRLANNIGYKRAVGTAAHADCHAYDDNDLDLADVSPAVRPYVEAWAQARADLGLVPISHARERYVYHPVFNYAGIIDGIFDRGGRRILVDIKTGDPGPADLQTGAYKAAWEREHPRELVDERLVIKLAPDMRVPYRVLPCDRPSDFGVFLACLTVYRELVKRGRLNEEAEEEGGIHE